ncbi:nitrous oxide reductase accessory protein NosL [Halobacteriales archaeon Cl-PHB]
MNETDCSHERRTCRTAVDDETAHRRRRETAGNERAVTTWPLTRRQAVAGGLGLVVGLAGCLGGDGDGGPAPDPVTLTAGDSCEVCGMVIPNHPGPDVEIFYADNQPSGHDNPAHFCSTWEAFQYDFERQDWTRQAFYVTDYSAVDYEIFQEGGDLLISSHPEAEAFVAASEVTFVVGSEVLGAMGKDLIAFSERSDAEQFQTEYGGQLMGFDDVTPSVISQLARS